MKTPIPKRPINTIRLGYFRGTNRVNISTDLIDYELSQANGRYFELDVPETPGASTTTASLSNDIGSAQEQHDVVYISEHSPVINGVAAFRNSNNNLEVHRDVEGADEMVIYLHERADMNDLGLEVGSL